MNNNTKKQNIKQDAILEKCTGKKKKNPKFSSYIQPLISKKMLELIKDCGSFLMLLGDLNLENKKLYKGNFCKNRFCPMCSWRLSCKESLEISILMEHLRKEENKEFIFLTLTTPNVSGDELESSIKEYNKSFERLMKLKEVKKVVKGYIRKLEVTYQKEKYITKDLWKQKKYYYKKRGLKVGDLEPNYNTYNPHFHVIIAVNKTYFKKTDLYITQEKWLELWKQSTRNELITQVDVRKSKANDYKEVYELAKYSAKDTDYLINRQVFETFYKALKGKQEMVFGGLFKDAHKMYKNHELDVYKEQDNINYVYMLYYDWHKTQYEIFKKRELIKEEFEEVNKSLINDLYI
ncbi:protein rep [Clostridium tarantellae]|uniref:Replication protein n=1 Tax=Clostridium tarantellae TaxID=39493 RepID=A0A6I1MNU5_9CLOT|nr:protein rep [Clostridium tarantellae]MPQ44714.1 replication protein [Clostridium tarantellae]